MCGATPAAASCARAGSQTRETKSSFVIATGGAPSGPGGTETRTTFAAGTPRSRAQAAASSAEPGAASFTSSATSCGPRARAGRGAPSSARATATAGASAAAPIARSHMMRSAYSPVRVSMRIQSPSFTKIGHFSS